MLKDTKNNGELFLDDFNHKKSKKCTKWLKNKYFNKKYPTLGDIRDKKVYFETLSVSSVKRSIYRIYRNLFKRRSSGYEKFLSDEEKRFCFPTDRSLVEGIY